VNDHAEALWQVLTRGAPGRVYNIGGNCERTNLSIVHAICDVVDELAPQLGGNSRKLIKFVEDRPGHDLRYAIDSCRIERELGWHPKTVLETGLRETVRWYLENQEWVKLVAERGGPHPQQLIGNRRGD